MNDDDDLLTLLAQALADDQPPAHAMEAAYAALEWRTIDAELAALLDDSQVEVMLFDSATYSRVLSYRAEHGSIEVGLADDRLEVVVGPPPVEVTMLQPEEATELELDENGRAEADGVSGSVRFRITWADGSTLTPWITL